MNTKEEKLALGWLGTDPQVTGNPELPASHGHTGPNAL